MDSEITILILDLGLAFAIAWIAYRKSQRQVQNQDRDFRIHGLSTFSLHSTLGKT